MGLRSPLVDLALSGKVCTDSRVWSVGRCLPRESGQIRMFIDPLLVSTRAYFDRRMVVFDGSEL